MIRRDRKRVLVLGPDPWRVRLLPALAGAGLHAVDGADPGIDALLVHADHGGPGEGPSRLRSLLARGTGPGLGAAPARAADIRDAFERAGAADVLSSAASPNEAARRVRRVLEYEALARRVRQQDLELILVSSMARRLLRAPDPESLVSEAVDVLGRTLGLSRAEAHALAEPLGATADIHAGWTPSGRVDPVPSAALEAAEQDAIARREPFRTADGKCGEVVMLPLVSRGRALAVLRLFTSPDAPIDDSGLAMLFGAGNLLAEALAHSVRVAQLRGRSRDLEALAAEQARESEEQRTLFQAVVDALPVSLHAIDREYRVVVWNRSRESGPLGRPRGEVLGRDLFKAIGPDPELRLEYEDVFRTGQMRATEVQSRSNGTARLFRVEKMPMRVGSDETISHVITLARDVTEQRSFERAMAQAEKMAAVGRLAAGIAHEINNPLATIAGCAEALRGRLAEPIGDAERAEARDDAGVIEDEAYRCKEILGGLLDFSRAAPDGRTECDPVELLQRSSRLLKHNPRVAGVTMTLDVHPGVPRIVASEDQVVQVLLALVLNAADAAGPGGKVTLAVRRHRDHVVLSVSDDGPGIPPELRERIFEPFFTTKPAGLGTGLGLSVAYGLVQAHGGRLEVHSIPGHGARFDVVLPIDHAPGEVSP